MRGGRVRRLLIAGWLAAASVTGACQRGPDVQRIADGALDSVALGDKVDATFDEASRVLRLSGTVESLDQRTRAAEAVQASIGAHAQVANEIVVEGPHADAADDLDEGIEERFETLLAHATDVDGDDVDLRVENGVVTLTGTVGSDSDRTKIEGFVRSIPGVNEVVNSVTVEGAPNREPRPGRRTSEGSRQ